MKIRIYSMRGQDYGVLVDPGQVLLGQYPAHHADTLRQNMQILLILIITNLMVIGFEQIFDHFKEENNY